MVYEDHNLDKTVTWLSFCVLVDHSTFVSTRAGAVDINILKVAGDSFIIL